MNTGSLRIFLSTTTKSQFLCLDCPTPVDPIPIVAGIVGGIVVIGIALLIAFKLFSNYRDKMEYERFQEEEKKRNWTEVSCRY